MKQTDSSPIRLGIAGIGGYAGHIAQTVWQWGGEVTPKVELHAVCDPNPQANPAQVEELKAHNVKILPSFEALLAEPIDAVWLPLPIQLHRPFLEQAIAAGKPVMVEKPAAATLQDLDAMVTTRDTSGLPVAVGFQDIYDAHNEQLKREILDGKFGQIKHVSIHACWPRGSDYYERNNWAGALRRGDDWVLDSPLNNALAHPVNLAMFLLGPTMMQSAKPIAVEAELYRANTIENYDTASVRVQLDHGVELLIHFTHACEGRNGPIITLEGEQSRVVYNPQNIQIIGDENETRLRNHEQTRKNMVERFAKLVRQTASSDMVYATLEIARMHTLIVNSVSEAATVYDVPADLVEILDVESGTLRAITGIEAAFEHCAQNHQMLHESGQLSFTRPAAAFDLENYERFAGPAVASTV